MPKVQKPPMRQVIKSSGLGPQRPAIVSDGDLADIQQSIELMTNCGITLRQIEAAVGFLIEKQQWESTR